MAGASYTTSMYVANLNENRCTQTATTALVCEPVCVPEAKCFRGPPTASPANGQRHPGASAGMGSGDAERHCPLAKKLASAPHSEPAAQGHSLRLVRREQKPPTGNKFAWRANAGTSSPAKRAASADLHGSPPSLADKRSGQSVTLVPSVAPAFRSSNRDRLVATHLSGFQRLLAWRRTV